jgi:hypothetical protein
MFTALAMTLATMMAPPLPPVPAGALVISWNKSPMGRRSDNPDGAGTGVLGLTSEPHVWRWDRNDGSERRDYCQLCGDVLGGFSFVLNTPGANVEYNRGMTQDPSIIGFRLTNFTAAPFMLEFTADHPVGTGWPDGLVMTITSP